MTYLTKIAVLGATGQQGGSVAKALSDKGGVTVVAITRNAQSEKAKALAEAPNTEVRVADLNDTASLIKAFAGCDGAFVIANFWEGMNVDTEVQQYANAVAALKETPTMKHIVYSTLEETTVSPISDDFKTLHDSTHESSKGPMKVPHFDGKARVEKLFADLPTTFLVTSCYFENFCSFFAFSKQEDGSYAFTLPLADALIPWTILADLGTLVASALEKPELIGKRIGQASFFATGNDLAVIFSKATGKTITYNKVTWETFASFGFPGADELAQMFEFWIRTLDDFSAARSLEAQKAITGGADFTDAVAYAKTLPLKFEG